MIMQSTRTIASAIPLMRMNMNRRPPQPMYTLSMPNNKTPISLPYHYHSTLISHPRRITPHLLPLTTRPIPKPSLLPPPPPIPVLFIKLPNRA